jgi:hypothetical protein
MVHAVGIRPANERDSEAVSYLGLDQALEVQNLTNTRSTLSVRQLLTAISGVLTRILSSNTKRHSRPAAVRTSSVGSFITQCSVACLEMP